MAGMTAKVKTKIPMPPIHWVKDPRTKGPWEGPPIGKDVRARRRKTGHGFKKRVREGVDGIGKQKRERTEKRQNTQTSDTMANPSRSRIDMVLPVPWTAKIPRPRDENAETESRQHAAAYDAIRNGKNKSADSKCSVLQGIFVIIE
jgi:hypothetical protein